MPKFYGYCRASTAGQQYTYEAQRAAIQKAYDSKYKDEGYEWGGFFEDKATSGGKPFTEREHGLALWVSAQPGDVVCWSKMDRAFRNVYDAAQLIQMFDTKGIKILSLDIALDTGTSLGKFVMHLLASVAEMEREWVRTRTRDALAIRQSKGLPHAGRPPVGWMKKPDGKWVPDQTERKLIEWLIYMHDRKGWSWSRLAAHLKRKKIKRANGHFYSQCFMHYAVKAREAGYPGRDGFRERCAYGGSVRREGKKPFRQKIKADLQRQSEVYPDDQEESSWQYGDHDQTDGQTSGN
jgi:DNA invertase Pin-like site-specific DNA recombinase